MDVSDIKQAFDKVFGDMCLSDNDVALHIFELWYKAGAAAENEACAQIVDAEIKLIGEKLQSIDERINSAIAIRERMNDD